MPHLKECTNEASGESLPSSSCVLSPTYTATQLPLPQSPLDTLVKSWCVCWCASFPAAKAIIFL